ncbi:MAG TPA: phosphatidate cytidylyltransferase [Magnetospirillaceae bacterium]|nr:phosphatidate cytidylyltransferase [Magnetospirillaceae bacterium]
MRNILFRFMLVAVVLPALYAAVVFLPGHGHAVFIAVVVGACAGCGAELASFFKRKGIRAEAFLFAFLSALPPALLWGARRVFADNPQAAGTAFLSGLGLVLLAVLAPFALSSRQDQTADALPRAAARVFPLLYPGLMAVSLVVIADCGEASTTLLLWFAMLVLGNDSMAWAVGMVLGRHRGVVPVSPNKSLEGFAGAYAGSLAAAFLGPKLFPAQLLGSPWRLLILGLVVGTAAVAGDLFESALKRSAGMKDSGRTIPGRGGVLDSFDSIIFAAPVFLAAIDLLGLVRG